MQHAHTANYGVIIISVLGENAGLIKMFLFGSFKSPRRKTQAWKYIRGMSMKALDL